VPGAHSCAASSRVGGVEQFATHPCAPPSIPHIPEATSGACGMGMGETTVELVTSCSWMMDLLGAPRDISFFGKLIQREIIYRLPQGSLGARLRAIATFETKCHRVAIGQLVPDCRKKA